MTEKHTVIDENKIYDELYSRLDDSYTLTYVSYDDQIQPATLNKILKEGLDDNLWEIFSEQAHYYAVKELNNLLDELEELSDDEKELFKTTDKYDQLILEIKSRDDSEAEKEIFCRSRIHARVTLHSNYDAWTPLYASKGLYGKDDALEGMMTALCLNPAKVKKEATSRGVDCFGSFPNYKHKDGKEIISYKGFLDCLIECPNYGLFTFFGLFDMKALWNTGLYDTPQKEQFDNLVIPAGTTCTIFNSWVGGGSCDFTETLRDVTIKELKRKARTQYDEPSIDVDEKFKDANGYSSGEVYGGFLSSKEILKAKKTRVKLL